MFLLLETFLWVNHPTGLIVLDESARKWSRFDEETFMAVKPTRSATFGLEKDVIARPPNR